MERRRRARRRALQALYQWQVKGEEDAAGHLVQQFREHQDFSQVDLEYFTALVYGVLGDVGEIDKSLGEFLDRPLADIDHIERAIMRLASYELLEQPDVPALVILDEAIELAHGFGAEQGHTYVNGVLDKAARSWRSSEFASHE